MIILGVDPGTNITGYGIIRYVNRQWQPLDFGAIRPPRTAKMFEKHLVIFEAISHLIDKFNPEALAVETQFVGKNAASALKLGMARGAATMPAALNKLEVFEYTPKKVKLSVVGDGNASKTQVQYMVQRHLKLAKPPEPFDAADALAIAMCHAYYKDKACLNIFAVN